MHGVLRWHSKDVLPHLDVCQKGSNRLLMSSCRPGLIQPWLLCVCSLLQQLQHTQGCCVEGSPVMTRQAAMSLCECHTSRSFALTHSRHAWSTTACCSSVPLLSTCMHTCYQSRQQLRSRGRNPYMHECFLQCLQPRAPSASCRMHPAPPAGQLSGHSTHLFNDRHDLPDQTYVTVPDRHRGGKAAQQC